MPGVFEIPVVISRNIKKYEAFIALGCVIKGETPHFDLICSSTFNVGTSSRADITFISS